MNRAKENKSSFKPSNYLLLCACALLTVCLLVRPQVFTAAVSDALSYCLKVLVPALLPFIIAGRLLYSAGFLTFAGRYAARPLAFVMGMKPQSAAVFLLSLVTGPPTGASLAAKLYESGVISGREAERLIAVSSGVSPMYLAAGVGISLLGDASFGFKLWGFQAAASLLFAVLTADRNKDRASDAFRANDGDSKPFCVTSAMSESIAAGGLTMLNVCTTVIFFSCIGSLLALVFPDAALFLRPLTELSSGIAALSSVGAQCSVPTAYIAFCCGFSGAAMIMQSASEASKCGIPMRLPLIFRVLCGAVCGTAALFW